ncbi:MAG: type 4 pilus major pilin [Rhodospirillales bacterium]|nr:type 4 pilus major pilin [Rhodospirillales bacterium]
MKDKNSQSGYTLLEAIMFIALISMVAVAIVNVSSKMLDRYRISRLVSQAVEIAQNFAHRCAAAEDYSKCAVGGKAKMLCTEKLLPGDIKCKNNTFKHKYGGNVTFGSVSGHGLDSKNTFSIVFYDVPQTACIELITYSWDNLSYVQLAMLMVNSKGWYMWKFSNNSSNLLPISVKKATELCYSRTSNQVFLTFQ